jgi:hypothetical protein
VGYVERVKLGAMADGLLRALDSPETTWLSCFLFPLRGAESLGIVAGMSVVLWLFTVLIPEYCLAIMAHADAMGFELLGYFIALISIVPVAILLPFALSYGAQYLARVLVSGAMGDTVPPRTPDRNFEGVINGLSPWFVWLMLGVGVGLAPLFTYWYLHRSAGDASPAVALALFLPAVPYIIMAFMISFLHDHALAATPLAVLGALLRLRGSFLTLSLFVAGAMGAACGSFLIALSVRAHFFGLYVLLALGCWLVLLWVLIVVMRVLGLYYFQRRKLLRWHEERPRWGVRWKL